MLNFPNGVLSYELWKIFKTENDYTKKYLYMIFGLSEDQNAKNICFMAERNPSFNKILKKYTV